MMAVSLLRLRVFVAAFAAFAALAGAAPSGHAQPADTELAGPALLAALRGGGYILFFRHAATDFGQNDEHMIYGRFLAFSVVGALLWVGLLVSGGYLFGTIPIVRENFAVVILGVVALSIAPLVVEYSRAQLRR